MFNRKYKKGMADAAKAYEAFGKKQEDALNHILEEVRSGNKDITEAVQQLNGNIDNLYEHLKSREKAQLYTVYTPFDIKELGEQERLFLVGALYRLTTDRTPNENQQNYLRAIQKHLDIKEPPFGTDPMAIENIEDIPSQKAIFQAVLEFLCLQDGDSYDETELQQDFLDAFSINSKNRQVILEHVELLYTATGAKGLAEKYGYVPEEEPEDCGAAEEAITTFDESQGWVEPSDKQSGEIFDEIFLSGNSNVLRGILAETSHYFVIWEIEDDEDIGFRKSTIKFKSFNKLNMSYEELPNLEKYSIVSWYSEDGRSPVYVDGDKLYMDTVEKEDTPAIWVLDLISRELKIVHVGISFLEIGLNISAIEFDGMYIPCIQNDRLCIYDVLNDQVKKIRYNNMWLPRPLAGTISASQLIMIVKESTLGIGSKELGALCNYDIEKEQFTVLAKDSDQAEWKSHHLFAHGGKLDWGYQDQGNGLIYACGKIFMVSNRYIYIVEIVDNELVKVQKVTDRIGFEFRGEIVFYRDRAIWLEDQCDCPVYMLDFETEVFRRIADNLGDSNYPDEILGKIGSYMYTKNLIHSREGHCISLKDPDEIFNIPLTDSARYTTQHMIFSRYRF